MIGVLNYGMGNLASVHNALNHLNLPNRFVETPSEIAACDRLVIPGVGAFGLAMSYLQSRGLIPAIQEFALVARRPLLGICLGMQLLLDESSEHGVHNGLGLVRGRVSHMGERCGDLPVPHIGWNQVMITGSTSLLRTLAPDNSFYFVHSYYCSLADPAAVTGTTEYGFPFDAVFEHNNICGCQFHPEKSQADGLTLLANFGKF